MLTSSTYQRTTALQQTTEEMFKHSAKYQISTAVQAKMGSKLSTFSQSLLASTYWSTACSLIDRSVFSSSGNKGRNMYHSPALAFRAKTIQHNRCQTNLLRCYHRWSNFISYWTQQRKRFFSLSSIRDYPICQWRIEKKAKKLKYPQAEHLFCEGNFQVKGS